MSVPDCLVVGAGIVGAACAWFLARAGLSVEVFERSAPAGGATAAGMGHLVVMDDSPAQLALTHRSCQLWDEIASELPAHCEAERCGTLWVATDHEEMRAAAAKLDVYRKNGVEARLLDARQLQVAEPNLRRDLVGALEVPGDAVVYPPNAAQWMLERAVADGARVHSNCDVTRIDDGSIVTGDGAVHAARYVIDAAGVDALTLLAGEAPPAIRPRKGHLVITNRAAGFCRHQIVELGYLKSAHGHASSSVAFNIQPRRTGQMLIGSSRQYDVTDAGVEPVMLQRMLLRAREYMPAIDRLVGVRAWTGMRPATPDGLPLIGPVPGMPRVLLAAGHEGLGITTSLGTGELITDLVTGRASRIDRAAYAPARISDWSACRAS